MCQITLKTTRPNPWGNQSLAAILTCPLKGKAQAESAPYSQPLPSAWSLTPGWTQYSAHFKQEPACISLITMTLPKSSVLASSPVAPRRTSPISQSHASLPPLVLPLQPESHPESLYSPSPGRPDSRPACHPPPARPPASPPAKSQAGRPYPKSPHSSSSLPPTPPARSIPPPQNS